MSGQFHEWTVHTRNDGAESWASCRCGWISEVFEGTGGQPLMQAYEDHRNIPTAVMTIDGKTITEALIDMGELP